ncbi:MAG: hypothetical protein Q8O41_12250 [Candidatus Methanoperedens sp.]|nr:hypothetical protein [Candidatus Methanoperedens sp.]
MDRKPNLKRKKPVRFEPLTGERGKKLLRDIAPEEKKIKIFLDLEDEMLDSKSRERNPEAEYLENHQRYMQAGNYEVKLIQDVIIPDVVERKANNGIIQRLKKEDEEAVKGTKEFLEKLKKTR